MRTRSVRLQSNPQDIESDPKNANMTKVYGSDSKIVNQATQQERCLKDLLIIRLKKSHPACGFEPIKDEPKNPTVTLTRKTL